MLGFQDEARFGRISDPKRCWAPAWIRPLAALQIIREYTYAYGTSFPQTGESDYLILPDMQSVTMEYYLQEVSNRHHNAYILLVMDNASCHRTSTLKIPENIEILSLPAYSPDFNPQENMWDEIREKYFGNAVFKDMDAVEAQMIVALLACEGNTELVRSITGRDWILKELV